MSARSKPWVAWPARLALVLGIGAPLLIAVGAAGTRLGLWDWTVGFGRVTVGWGPKVATAAAIVGLIAVLLSLADRRHMAAALVGLLVGGGTLGAFHQLRTIARANPIHDVSTDWTNPPTFSAALMEDRRRTGARNPVEADPRVTVDGRERRVAEVSAEVCQGARPVLRTVAPDEAAAALTRAGVVVTGRTPTAVEGTNTSLMFGFMDDVVVRLGPDRTDVRSVSRVGGSDLGANCRRVNKVLAALNAG